MKRLTPSIVALLCLSAQAQSLPAPPVSPAPITKYEYDAQGNPTKTVQAPGTLNLSTQATYDSLSRLKDSTDANLGKTQLSYDGLDRTLKVTDPRNLVTQTPRNGLGDATQLISPDTGTASHTYDAAGNLKTRTDSRGVKATYTYDALNRLTRVAYSQGAASQAYSWAYDQVGASFTNGIGRLTSSAHPAGSTTTRYDAQGRVTADVQRVNPAPGANPAQVSKTVTYTFDAAGHVTSIVYPSGRKLSITLTAGQPTAMSLAKNAGSVASPLISAIQWEPFGAPGSWQWQLASGPQTHARVVDSSGRLVRYRLGTSVRDLSYDAADRISAYTHYNASTGVAQPALNQSFTYDALGRLTQTTLASGAWSFSYDANGNRMAATVSGSTSNYATAATSNRLTSITNPSRSFAYDSAGNTTNDGRFSATYDLAGRMATLTKAGVTSTYSYDGFGRRVRKVSSTGVASTVIFVYDQNGQLLSELDSTGAAIREYVWLGSTPVAVFTPDPVSATNPPLVFYIHADHLDTPRVIVDRNNAIRWRWMAEPFGVNAPETNPGGLGAFTFNLRFPGQYFDQESGLHYNYFRSYDSSIGRYTTSDPIGLAGGSMSTYAYVGGQPTRFTDPLGLWATDAHDYFIDKAFQNLSPELRDIIKEGSAYIDTPKYQDDSHSGLHAMTSGTMDQAQARMQMCKFVKEYLGRSNAAKAQGDPRYLYYLGMALHPVMDYTSPAHRGWQMWHGASDASKHGPWSTSMENIKVAKQPRYTQETLDLINRALSGDLSECECR